MSYHVDPDFLPPGARVNTTYTRRVLLRRLDQAIRRIEAKAKANPEYAEDYPHRSLKFFPVK